MTNQNPESPVPEELTKLLMEHSPRVVIEAPILVPYPASPTGWLTVVPTAPVLNGLIVPKRDISAEEADGPAVRPEEQAVPE